jgi:hypothetical protein
MVVQLSRAVYIGYRKRLTAIGDMPSQLADKARGTRDTIMLKS